MGWREDLHRSYQQTLQDYLKELSAWGIRKGATTAASAAARGTYRSGAYRTRSTLIEGFKQQAAANLAAKLAAAEAAEAASREEREAEKERQRKAAIWGTLGKIAGTAVAIPLALTGNIPAAGMAYSLGAGLGAGVQQWQGGVPGSMEDVSAMTDVLRLMEYRKWLDQQLGGGYEGGYGAPLEGYMGGGSFWEYG